MHRLVGQRPELGAKRCDHPAREVEIAAIGGAEMLLHRNQLLLGDEAMPATERLGVFRGILIIGRHIGAHQRRGVAGDVEAGPEAVLQAHARHGLGGDAGPGRLGLEQRLGSSNLVEVGGSRSLDSLVAHAAWLVVHVRIPSLFSTFVTVHCKMRADGPKRENLYNSYKMACILNGGDVMLTYTLVIDVILSMCCAQNGVRDPDQGQGPHAMATDPARNCSSARDSGASASNWACRRPRLPRVWAFPRAIST